jgi:hypothetical protein
MRSEIELLDVDDDIDPNMLGRRRSARRRERDRRHRWMFENERRPLWWLVDRLVAARHYLEAMNTGKWFGFGASTSTTATRSCSKPAGWTGRDD